MPVVKNSVLFMSALISAGLLVGCQSEGAPDTFSSEAVATAPVPPEDAEPEADPAQEVEEAEPVAAGPASEEADEPPREDSGSVEDRVIASIEEVLGEEGCWKRDEHSAGTPLEDWTFDPFYIDEYGAGHGALEGTLVRYWCEQHPDSAGHPASPASMSVGIFTDAGDFESDKEQLLHATRTLEGSTYYANHGELWTATAWGASRETFHYMEDLGAPGLSFDGH